MIFGRTDLDQLKAEQEDIINKINGIKEFCLIPKELRDGRMVWLQYVYTYYKGGVDSDGIYFLLHTDSGSPIKYHYLDMMEENVSLIRYPKSIRR